MTHTRDEIKRAMELIEYSTTHAILPEGMADAVKLLRDVVQQLLEYVKGPHRLDCYLSRFDGDECTCGRNELLALFKEAQEKKP